MSFPINAYTVIKPGCIAQLVGHLTHKSEVLSLLPGLATYFRWLVGCFGFNGPLRQYFSLYRAVSQREGEREDKG